MSNSNKTYIAELKNNIEQEVTLAGWLYNSRASGKIQFLIVRDRDSMEQTRITTDQLKIYVREKLDI
jgi:aspartyl/asparaginyl-tRNA synthetase